LKASNLNICHDRCGFSWYLQHKTDTKEKKKKIEYVPRPLRLFLVSAKKNTEKKEFR
jgi:hypothetical protein